MHIHWSESEHKKLYCSPIKCGMDFILLHSEANMHCRRLTNWDAEPAADVSCQSFSRLNEWKKMSSKHTSDQYIHSMPTMSATWTSNPWNNLVSILKLRSQRIAENLDRKRHNLMRESSHRSTNANQHLFTFLFSTVFVRLGSKVNAYHENCSKIFRSNPKIKWTHFSFCNDSLRTKRFSITLYFLVGMLSVTWKPNIITLQSNDTSLREIYNFDSIETIRRREEQVPFLIRLKQYVRECAMRWPQRVAFVSI